MTTAQRLAPTLAPSPAAPAPPAPVAAEPIQFPDFPPRDDMQNSLYLNKPGHIHILCAHFGNPDTTVVLGEVPVGWVATGARIGLRIPDLLIAFDIWSAAVVATMGYSISEHGKPPDFVLEIASPTTARRDEIEKPGDYADFGVPEYWRFDHEWGRNYATGLAGDRLVSGVYLPIPIHQAGPEMYWGHSAVLNLDLCWEYGELRFYDPAAQRYLTNYETERDTRIAEQAARIAAEEALDVEQAARIAAEEARVSAEEARDAEQAARIAEQAARVTAEEARDAEQSARIAAEADRDAEQAARIAAETQLAELQAELARRNAEPPSQ